MMFKENVFKSLVKQAYKGRGLVVGKDKEDYILSGGYWTMRINEDAISNKALATIIEMTGKLPEEGEIWKIYDGGVPQYEIDTELYETDIPAAAVEGEITNVLIKQKETICNVIKDGKRCILVNSCFDELVDLKSIREDIGEEPPEGPFVFDKSVYWENNMCTILCYIRTEDEEDTDSIKALRGMEM